MITRHDLRELQSFSPSVRGKGRVDVHIMDDGHADIELASSQFVIHIRLRGEKAFVSLSPVVGSCRLDTDELTVSDLSELKRIVCMYGYTYFGRTTGLTPVISFIKNLPASGEDSLSSSDGTLITPDMLDAIRPFMYGAHMSIIGTFHDELHQCDVIHFNKGSLHVHLYLKGGTVHVQQQIIINEVLYQETWTAFQSAAGLADALKPYIRCLSHQSKVRRALVRLTKDLEQKEQ